MNRLARINLITYMARSASNINEQVGKFIADAQQLAADGLTLVELGQLFTALVALAVDAAAKLQNSGPEKKLFVLNAVGYLYDALAPVVPLPWFLAPFRAILRPYIRAAVLSLADGVVEAVYHRLLDDPAFSTP